MNNVSRILAGESLKSVFAEAEELKFEKFNQLMKNAYSGAEDFKSGEEPLVATTKNLIVIVDGNGVQISAQFVDGSDAFEAFLDKKFKSQKEALDFIKSAGLNSDTAFDSNYIEKKGFISNE